MNHVTGIARSMCACGRTDDVELWDGVWKCVWCGRGRGDSHIVIPGRGASPIVCNEPLDLRAYNNYVYIRDETAYQRALSLARGSYQRNVLLGAESLSGATLRGTARNWGCQYQRSVHNLLARLRENGIAVSEARGRHNKRVLVIG